MDAKMVAAAGFAALGVAWGAWGLVGGGGGAEEPQRRARVVVEPVDASGNAVTPSYERVRRNGDALAARIAGAAFEGAKALAGFGTQGDGAAERFVGAVEGVVLPLVEGDHDGFMAAMRAMGAAVGEIEGEHPIFKTLAGLLRGAEVDVSRVDVRAYEGRGPGSRLGEGAARGEMREMVREMRAGRMFPDAMEGLDGRAVEVRFPFKPRGEDERWLGIVLVWHGELGVWQAGAFRVSSRGRGG